MITAIAAMLLCAAYYLWREHSLTCAFGFPLDDSWIHAQFARNLALGRGFSYNPGVPASGSTAPLWTLVCATGYLISGDPVLSAKLLGLLFLGFAVGFVYLIVRTVSDDAREALFAAVVVASLPRMIWASLSGMEVTLAVTLTLAGIFAHIAYGALRDRRQYLSTVLLGLAALARPECAVFFAAAMIDRALASVLIRWREIAAREWLVPVLIHVVLFAAVVSPFVLFSRRFGIGFMPNTAYAKALLWGRGLIAALAQANLREAVRSFTVRPFDYFVSFLAESLRDNPVLFVLGGFGFLRLVLDVPYADGSRYRSFIIPLAAMLFPVAIGVFVPFGTAGYQEGRYSAPAAPLVLIIGTVGLYAAARYGARIFSRAKLMGAPAKVVLERSLIWLFMFLAVCAQGRGVWVHGKTYAKEVGNIEDMQVSLGRWIDQNLPRDAVIAVNDIGAIGYFSGRTLLDTVGLISPEVLGYLRRGLSPDEAMYSFLETKRPDYAVLFPNWYPESVRRTSVFEPIHEVRLTENLVCGGDVMVVYRLNWGEAGRTDEGFHPAHEAARGGASVERVQR